MKPTRKLISFLLVMLFLLLACQLTGIATPTADVNGPTAASGDPARPKRKPIPIPARKTV